MHKWVRIVEGWPNMTKPFSDRIECDKCGCLWGDADSLKSCPHERLYRYERLTDGHFVKCITQQRSQP